MHQKLSLKQMCYESIKEKILNCEYEPNSFLNEDFLCKEFEVSRTPIRDALGRLEQERLITILPKKGVIVAPLSVNEINMVFEGRLLIEPYVLLNYCANMSSDTLDYMYQLTEDYKKAIERQSSSIYELDNKFHYCMVKQCTNRYLLNTYDEINNQDRRLRILSGRSNDRRLYETVNEHLWVLDCIRKSDLKMGEEMLRKHIINSKVSAFDVFLEGQM